MVTGHRGSFAAAGPIAAGHVLPSGKCAPVCLGTGKNVMPVGLIAAAIDGLSPFTECGLFVQLILAVQFFDIAGD